MANQKEELDSIRNLVADISKNLGMDESSGLLKKDVDFLGQKLDSVSHALTQMTEVAKSMGQKTLSGDEDGVLIGIKEVRLLFHSLFIG